MTTTSEIAVNVTIWALTLSGAFFGGRAFWRRKMAAIKNKTAKDKSPV